MVTVLALYGWAGRREITVFRGRGTSIGGRESLQTTITCDGIPKRAGRSVIGGGTASQAVREKVRRVVSEEGRSGPVVTAAS